MKFSFNGQVVSSVSFRIPANAMMGRRDPGQTYYVKVKSHYFLRRETAVASSSRTEEDANHSRSIRVEPRYTIYSVRLSISVLGMRSLNVGWILENPVGWYVQLG